MTVPFIVRHWPATVAIAQMCFSLRWPQPMRLHELTAEAYRCGKRENGHL